MDMGVGVVFYLGAIQIFLISMQILVLYSFLAFFHRPV